MDRRQFLAAGFAAPAALAAQTAHEPAQAATGRPTLFRSGFGYTAQVALWAPATIARQPGQAAGAHRPDQARDFDSAWRAYYDAGVQARKQAEAAAAKRHMVSAREAYLWAAEYFSCALRFLDLSRETESPSPS